MQKRRNLWSCNPSNPIIDEPVNQIFDQVNPWVPDDTYTTTRRPFHHPLRTNPKYSFTPECVKNCHSYNGFCPVYNPSNCENRYCKYVNTYTSGELQYCPSGQVFNELRNTFELTYHCRKW